MRKQKRPEDPKAWAAVKDLIELYVSVGWTAVSVAERWGFEHVNDWRNNRVSPKRLQLEQIARAEATSVDVLLDGYAVRLADSWDYEAWQRDHPTATWGGLPPILWIQQAPPSPLSPWHDYREKKRAG